MKRTRRLFSREFKVEAVRQLLGGKRPAAVVARELGIGADVLRRWRDELSEQGSGSAGSRTGPAVTSDDEELRRLRRENAVLREEREILKKATAFFARESR
jgi:transposase